MTAPRHLWSGDWQRESAAAAEEFAKRRGPADAPAEPPPAEPPPAEPAPAPPSPLARYLAALRGVDGRRVRRAVLIGVATLLSVGAAYAAVSALTSTADNPAGAQHASGGGIARAWLGVDTTSFPLSAGAMIVDVVPGSPADAAGLQPGEVITEVDSHPVQTPADLESALAGLHAGERAQIGYQLGPSTYTTQVTLQIRPPGP